MAYRRRRQRGPLPRPVLRLSGPGHLRGRSVDTVVGPLTSTEPGQVGDYRTTYLVVTVERHRLWPERRAPEVIYVPDPFWYGAVYPWGYRRGFW